MITVTHNIEIKTTNQETADTILGIYHQADRDVQEILAGSQKPAAYDPKRPPRCAECGCPGDLHPTRDQAPGTPVQNCRLCGRCPGYRPRLQTSAAEA